MTVARLISDLHHAIGVDPGPVAVLAALNEALLKHGRRGMFVTMAYGVTEPGQGRLRLALAGHPPPLVRRADGWASPLELPSASPLGILSPARLQAAEVELQGGEVLILYTDGATEARGASEGDFTADRLAQALEQAGRSADGVVDFLFRRLKEFTGEGPARDDITLLALRAH